LNSPFAVDFAMRRHLPFLLFVFLLLPLAAFF
jgi:hypothetical protein